MRRLAQLLILRAIQRYDRARLRVRCLTRPGLDIDPAASTNLASARFVLAPGATLKIGAGVVTERRRDRLHVHVDAGARVEIGAGTWLRTDVGDIHIAAFPGATLSVGPDSFLNGCHLSAKRELVLGRRAWIGPGSRIFDADQHDYDAGRAEVCEPVSIGDYVWIASDVTVLRGVTIGAHSIVGARSLVTNDIPPHTLAFGQPARPRGKVGDRSRVR